MARVRKLAGASLSLDVPRVAMPGNTLGIPRRHIRFTQKWNVSFLEVL